MGAEVSSMTPWDSLVGAAEASFADVLRGLRPLMPVSLLDGEGWTRLLERAAELPAAAAAFFGFEFRLGDPDPSADLCVPVTFDIAAAATLEVPVVRYFIRQASSGTRLPPSKAALARCIAGFGRADSVLARWAQSVLLEYDVAALPAGSRSTSGIFFGLRRKPGPSGHDVQKAARRDIAGTLATACGRAADSTEQRAIFERAFDALPPGARINQAGAMPDRAGRAIRLVAEGIDEAAVPAFLARLGWPGPGRRRHRHPGRSARRRFQGRVVVRRHGPRARPAPRIGDAREGGRRLAGHHARRLATVRGQTGGEGLVHRVEGPAGCWRGPGTRRCTPTTRSSWRIRGSTT